MVKITTSGEALDLPDNFSMEIEDSSPVFNDRGSQSLPVTVPSTRRNMGLLGWPHRFDGADDSNIAGKTAIVADGAYIRAGILNITEASSREGVQFNIGFDNSTAYATWSQRRLADLADLPELHPEDYGGQGILDLMSFLHSIYMGTNGSNWTDLAVFPLAVNNESASDVVYWEILNIVGQRGLDQPSKVTRVIDGAPVEVSVPVGYGVSPFLRVWKVLELVFTDLGFTLNNNPFQTDPDFRRLVVLNNAADAICQGYIKYSDLMPDVTVEEFLNALWVRFGLIYNVNFDKGTVDLKFIRDIVTDETSQDMSAYLSDRGKTTFNQPQYIKLSAQTSIDGAAPLCSRFEDFCKGLEMSGVKMGTDVSSWHNTGTADNPVWDGADYPDREDRDDQSYPDNDRDSEIDGDYPDYAAPVHAQSGGQSESFLAREYVTGTWYRLDVNNGEPQAASSCFFDWDPQTAGVEPLELTSVDECVPIVKAKNTGTGTGWVFNDKCPAYLFGARHYHSYIKGSSDSDNNGQSTPLAFMLAFTVNRKTIGRLCAEDESGAAITPDDGSFPELSLLFQFKDGLFATFWKEYDEILRHAVRAPEVNLRIPKSEIQKIDLLRPIKVNGIPCLADKLTYSLPAQKNVALEMKLRSLLPIGNYDIDAEQGIPDFAAGSRRLVWRLYSDGCDSAAISNENRGTAARRYAALSGYKEHGAPGDYFYIDAQSVFVETVVKLSPTWDQDATLQMPAAFGQKFTKSYAARVTYDIHEIHDMTSGQDEERNEEILPDIIGQVTVTIAYSVTLVAEWS